MSFPTLSKLLETMTQDRLYTSLEESWNHYDVSIRFLSIENDIESNENFENGLCFFVADIDGQVRMTSPLMKISKSMEWLNEEWKILKIPNTARLYVKVYQIDDRSSNDKLLGEFHVVNLIDYNAPSKGHRIRGKNNRTYGYFRLSIESKSSSNDSIHLMNYTFDGPCRYTRHYAINSSSNQGPSIQSVWKIKLRRISSFLHRDPVSYSTNNFLVTRTMFNDSRFSFATQNAAKLAHERLNTAKTKRDENGFIRTTDELWKLVFSDPSTRKIRPAIYNYVIDDQTWRFIESDGEIFSNFSSKYSLLASGCKYVRLSGEFHLRPKYGWQNTSSQWELVFDNGSGPNAPEPNLLSNLKKLLIFNFPGLSVATCSAEDPILRESRQKTKDATEKFKREYIHTRTSLSTFSTHDEKFQ